MFLITKRFISYNGRSFISKYDNLYRIGNDIDKSYYYKIIQSYKILESKYKAILNNNKIYINPELNTNIALDILKYRETIQNLQYLAVEHFILHKDNDFKFISKENDKKYQKNHEYIINLYRKFLNLPSKQFHYPKLNI